MAISPAALVVIDEIDRALRANARTDFDAEYLQKYLGRERPALGLRNDTTRAIAKDSRKQHQQLTTDNWIEVLNALYQGETYEHRLVAGMMLADNRTVRQSVKMEQLRTWIAGLQGWAEIDGTCQSTWDGAEMAARWPEWQPFLAACALDSTISLRRASLVLFCKAVRSSDDVRLRAQAFANIDTLKTERAGLITKAVSWLLRDLIANNPAEVANYLNANAATLPAIAVRETRNKLATGKKNQKPSGKSAVR